MTALRMTRPARLWPARRVRAWALGLAALGVFGCGTASPPTDDPSPQGVASTLGVNDPAWLTSRGRLPAPDPDRIEYDAQKRMLTLYDRPGQDRWMVRLPDEQFGQLVGPQHRLPVGVDTQQVLVYYVRPGVKVSAPVTVAVIEAGRAAPNSLALNR